MRSLTTFMLSVVESNNQTIFNIFNVNALRYINEITKQLVEKMGKLRLVAGNSLQKFFYEFDVNNQLDKISKVVPFYEQIKTIF